ncbi:hypothetical protein H4219_005107 [Mycoemilia scoparia]|uniref:Uncharacterized protein n=1 Tax=Mycoemilia scoparia TaxID=417184 RepID=A0A9W7ZV62_9FUNG|nr:hypothetical protein H4219_005107 [Mycoemilia scoparia]
MADSSPDGLASIELLVDQIFQHSLYRINIIGDPQETLNFGSRLYVIKYTKINNMLFELNYDLEELLSKSSSSSCSSCSSFSCSSSCLSSTTTATTAAGIINNNKNMSSSSSSSSEDGNDEGISVESIQDFVNNKLKQKAISFAQSCLEVAETKLSVYSKSLSEFPWKDTVMTQKEYEEKVAPINPSELVDELKEFIEVLRRTGPEDGENEKGCRNGDGVIHNDTTTTTTTTSAATTAVGNDSTNIKNLSSFIAPAIYVGFRVVCAIFIQSVFFHRDVRYSRLQFLSSSHDDQNDESTIATIDNDGDDDDDGEKDLEISLQRFCQKNPKVDMSSEWTYLDTN